MVLHLFTIPVLSILAVSCVTMGKYNAMKDRVGVLQTEVLKSTELVAAMETRIDHLRELTKADDEAVRERLADLAADFAEFQMSMGTLQGRQEEIDFKLKAIAKHVKGLKGLVEDRFGVDSEVLPKELPTEPDALFELGMSNKGSGLNRKSRAIFQAFVKQFPEHDKADDAQFMIGETLFAEGRFTEAINAYRTVYDQYQTGDRHREAVLRIGLAYVRSNKCTKALKIYRFAKKTFKGTPEAEIAAKEIKELQKVCK